MKKSLFIGVILATILTSCSPKIVGTWNVDKYQVNNMKGQDITTRNAGEITLNKNGTGEKSIEYNIFNNQFSDVQSFRWNLQDTNLTITGTGDKKGEKSQFDKTWIVTTNKKDKQVWKSTDGSNAVQVIELSKKK